MSATAASTAPPGHAPPARRRSWAAPLFVWGVWGGLLVAALALVAAYGRNVPFQDEWEVVPQVAGEQPVTPAWLWAQHNDHRIPLPKLLLMGLYRLTDYDLRAGMVLNTLLLGALAAALVWAAGRVRGRASYADAFFPLMLLHWGHFENLLFSWQIAFILSTVLAGAFLLLVVRQAGALRLRPALLAGACLVALPLCGANGVALVPALALWLGYAGLGAWRSGAPGGRRAGAAALGLAAAGLALAGLYFRGLKTNQWHAPSAGAWASLRTALEVLSQGFLGATARALWPGSGAVALALLAVGAATVARAWQRRPVERVRILGLLAVFAGLVSLSLGLGWGRSGVIAGIGFSPRYLTLAVPAACALYFALGLYAPPLFGRLAQLALFLAAAVLLVPNTQIGRQRALVRRAWKEPFEHDLRAGAPPGVLGQNYGTFLYWSEERMAEGLRMLGRAGVGCFRDMRPDPAVREVSLPAVPASVSGGSWDNGTGRASAGGARLLFTLPEPRFVCAVRVSYSLAGGTAFPRAFEAEWRLSSRDDFSEQERRWRFAFHWEPTQRPPRETTRVVWVNDAIDQFRVSPDDGAGAFTISEIVLLVPAEGGRPGRDLSGVR
jgi:hypothetical protein